MNHFGTVERWKDSRVQILMHKQRGLVLIIGLTGRTTNLTQQQHQVSFHLPAKCQGGISTKLVLSKTLSEIQGTTISC